MCVLFVDVIVKYSLWKEGDALKDVIFQILVYCMSIVYGDKCTTRAQGYW